MDLGHVLLTDSVCVAKLLLAKNVLNKFPYIDLNIHHHTDFHKIVTVFKGDPHKYCSLKKLCPLQFKILKYFSKYLLSEHNMHAPSIQDKIRLHLSIVLYFVLPET